MRNHPSTAPLVRSEGGIKEAARCHSCLTLDVSLSERSGHPVLSCEQIGQARTGIWLRFVKEASILPISESALLLSCLALLLTKTHIGRQFD